MYNHSRDENIQKNYHILSLEEYAVVLPCRSPISLLDLNEKLLKKKIGVLFYPTSHISRFF